MTLLQSTFHPTTSGLLRGVLIVGLVVVVATLIALTIGSPRIDVTFDLIEDPFGGLLSL